MSEQWSWQDLVVSRVQARVLECAVYASLAEGDRDPEIYLEQLAREEGLTRGSTLMEAIRRLVERGWLVVRVEPAVLADFERRPARTYYRLTQAGAQAAELLVGGERGWIPQASVPLR